MISASDLVASSGISDATNPGVRTPSITKVNWVAGSPSSTAVRASGYWAPSITSAQATISSSSGAWKFQLRAATSAMNLVQERNSGL
jgi:hypothetical protein